MLTQELLLYVQTELQKGTPQGTIINNLNGWAPEDIQSALQQIMIPQSNTIPRPFEAQKETRTIKIVAGIYAVGGALSIIASIVSFGTFIFFLFNYDTLPYSSPTLYLIWLFCFSVCILAFSILDIRISSALHKLQRQGYQAAFALFLFGY